VDLVELYRRAVVGFTDRVRQVGPDQWTAPTPCADWDVRALVNHVVYEQRWAVPLFEGATIAEVGDRFEGDLLGADPVAVATEAGHASIDAVAGPASLDRTVHLSFGDTPGGEYLAQLLADHVVHAWDLAVAIGADPALDTETVRSCAAWYADREAMYRSGGAVGARVDVPAGRGEQAVLIGAFGRDPDWSPTRG
jgi:uncharacterized protein (TIGR03086 family)